MDYSYDYGYGDYGTSSLDGLDATMGAVAGGTVIVTLLISLAVGIVSLIAMIKLFKKFGKPGWAPIVPIYNMWVLLEMGGLPGWLCLIPIANYFCILVAYFQIAKKLGKSTGFAVCTIFFLPICMLIMGFDKSTVVEQGMNNNYNNQNMNNQPQMNNNQFMANNQQQMPQQMNNNQFVTNDQQPMQMPQQQMPQEPMVNINPEVATQPVNETPASTFVPSEPTAQPMSQQEVPNVDEPQFTSVDNSNNIQ